MRSGTATLTPDRFRRRKGPSRAGECLVICLCCFGLLVIEARFPAVQKARGLGELVKVPILAVLRFATDGVRGVEGYFRSQAALERENEDLRINLLRQNVQLQQMDLLRAENDELRSLLELDALLGSNNLAADTLPGNPDPARHRVTLSVGSRQGAYVGQPVVDSQGVVGQVTRDYLITSEALLISDSNHRLPVMFQRTGLSAIAFGTGRPDHRLSLQFMPPHSDVAEGDTVVSSGTGGRFPPGLQVGVVEDVSDASGQAFLEALVKPSANLERVRRVLLLRSEASNAGGPAPAAGS